MEAENNGTGCGTCGELRDKIKGGLIPPFFIFDAMRCEKVNEKGKERERDAPESDRL